MNKELSIVLRDKIANLPFIDVLAGVAQTLVVNDVNEETMAITGKRYPVSSDCLGVDCLGKEIGMLPSADRKSIIYFEDFGIGVTGRDHGHTGYNSSLRLICWLNRSKLVGEYYKNVSGTMMATIIDRLANKNPINVGIFQKLQITVARIPPQDAALFGKYTYSEPDRQYLRPPYEFFGIDFTCTYLVPAQCLQAIDWTKEVC